MARQISQQIKKLPRADRRHVAWPAGLRLIGTARTACPSAGWASADTPTKALNRVKTVTIESENGELTALCAASRSINPEPVLGFSAKFS